jgi:hypothetical protein
VFYLAPNPTSQCPAPMAFPYPTYVAVTPLLPALVASGHSKIVRHDCPDRGSPIAVSCLLVADGLLFYRSPELLSTSSTFSAQQVAARHSLSSSCFPCRVAASSLQPHPVGARSPRLLRSDWIPRLLGLVMFFR